MSHRLTTRDSEKGELRSYRDYGADVDELLHGGVKRPRLIIFGK